MDTNVSVYPGYTHAMKIIHLVLEIGWRVIYCKT